MASPTVSARTETQLANGTSLTINFTQTTGELVVVFLGLSDTAQVLATVGDSFTDLTAANATFHILSKVLDGSEGGTLVVTVGSSTKGAAIAYNIAGSNSGIAPEFSTVATGTDTAPDPGTVTPTGGAKDYLWIAAFRQNGEEADDDTWCTAAPSTPSAFGNLVQKTSAVAGLPATNGSIAAADLASNASSMNPGAFTTVQSLAWRAYTVAVHPAGAIDRTTTDAFTLADAITRTGTFGRTTTDAVTAADVATRTGTFLRSVADAIGLADVATQVKEITRTASDALGLSDVATRSIALLRSASDAVTVADVATRASALLRSATDAFTLSDIATRVGALLRTTTDALGLADVATRVIGGAAVVAGSIPPVIRSAGHAIARAVAGSEKPRGTGG